MKDILAGLNEEQKKAVLHTEGPQLILAGAGSGKTRTVTHKIAYLCQQGIDPKDILAITFTNKAANEMKERINTLVGSENDILACTFHSLCYRILKQHTKYRKYTIYDDKEQRKLIKKIIDSNIELADTHVGTAKSKITYAKNDMLIPDNFKYGINSYNEDDFYILYRDYQELLEKNKAMDFDDLLLNALQVLKDKMVKDMWQDEYKYIFVDEFQDTNKPQFLLTKILSGKHNNLCVVGDDNQSIYGWRGSNIDYILNLEYHFGQDVATFKLENNYRSTPTILKAAQEVIELNQNRSNKKIVPKIKDNNHKIDIIDTLDEKAEAKEVAYRIKSLYNSNKNLNDIAVLYRTNSQSRVIEDALRDLRIPCKIVGGTTFFQRKEVKDLIAYLKFIVNKNDTLSLDRIINFPNRGIGKATLSKIKKWSEDNDISSWEAAATFNNSKLQSFISFIDSIDDQKKPTDILINIVKSLNIIDYWKKHQDEHIDRIGNVWEFIELSRNFKKLDEFLEHIYLQTSIDESDESNAVTLMTCHASKGLEYSIIFMVGLNEELLPLPSDSIDELEEERRLCYVGMTRAMDRLYMSYTRQRMQFGRIRNYERSHLIDVIPHNLKREVKFQ